MSLEQTGAASEDVAESPPSSTAIIGAGPTGLVTAIMLARRGWTDISVYDKQPVNATLNSSSIMIDKSIIPYNLFLTPRGQEALSSLGCWSAVAAASQNVVGKLQWNVEKGAWDKGDEIVEGGSAALKAISREALAACLRSKIEHDYSHAISVKYGQELTGVHWYAEGEGRGASGVWISLRKRQVKARQAQLEKSAGKNAMERPPPSSSIVGAPVTIQAGFLVAADGHRSVVVKNMEKEWGGGSGLWVTDFIDLDARVYKTLRLSLRPQDKAQCGYRVDTGDGLILESLPSSPDSQIAVLLFSPQDRRVRDATTREKARALFAEHLPMIAPWIANETYHDFAVQPVYRIPSFRHVGEKLHRQNNTVLVGDVMHTIKPFFSEGINMAFHDVAILDQCLARHKGDRHSALEAYSKIRGPESVALVEMSRSLYTPGQERSGALFWHRLELLAHKFFPSLFTAPTHALLQSPDMSPIQVRKRKRLEKLALVAILFLGTPLALLLSFKLLLLLFSFIPPQFVEGMQLAVAAEWQDLLRVMSSVGDFLVFWAQHVFVKPSVIEVIAA